MKEKRFLISDHWVEDEQFEEEIESKIKSFIKENIKDVDLDENDEEILYGVHFTGEDFFDFSFVINVHFFYADKQDMTLYFTPREEQPHLIDGEWKIKYIYDCHTSSPVQLYEEIYGIERWELLHKFSDYMLTV